MLRYAPCRCNFLTEETCASLETGSPQGSRGLYQEDPDFSYNELADEKPESVMLMNQDEKSFNGDQTSFSGILNKCCKKPQNEKAQMIEMVGLIGKSPFFFPQQNLVLDYVRRIKTVDLITSGLTCETGEKYCGPISTASN